MNTDEMEVFIQLLSQFSKSEQRELISLVDDTYSTIDENQQAKNWERTK